MKNKILIFAFVLSPILAYSLAPIEFLPQQYYSALQNLPMHGVAQSVLEKNNAGAVWVSEDDRYAFVYSQYTLAFLVGDIVQDDVPSIIELCKALGKVSLVCDAKYHQWFVQQGFIMRPRVEFEVDQAKAAALPIESISIEPIISDTFEKCNWRDRIVRAFETKENFLQKGFGFIVRDGNTVISEIFSGFIGGNRCEIGIVSHPQYRGQGYVTSLLRAMYDECERRGLTLVASCDVANAASFLSCSKICAIKSYHVFLDNYIYDTSVYQLKK